MTKKVALISRYEFTVKESSNKGVVADYGLDENSKFDDSAKSAALIRRIFEGEGCCALYKEYCYAVMFDRGQHVIGYIKVSEGGTAATVIDQRIIIKACLDCNASAVILTHNHPSNNVRPGKSDLQETENLQKACKLLNISLVDHIIIGSDRYYSFADMEVKKFEK